MKPRSSCGPVCLGKEGSCFYVHATATRIAATTAALLGSAAPSISTAQADQLRGASLRGPPASASNEYFWMLKHASAQWLHGSAVGGLGAWVTQEHCNQSASDQRWYWTFDGQGRKVLPKWCGRGDRDVIGCLWGHRAVAGTGVFGADYRAACRAETG